MRPEFFVTGESVCFHSMDYFLIPVRNDKSTFNPFVNILLAKIFFHFSVIRDLMASVKIWSTLFE